MKSSSAALLLAILIAWFASLPVAFFVVDLHGTGLRLLKEPTLTLGAKARVLRDAWPKVVLRPYARIYGTLCHSIRCPIDLNAGVYGKEGWAFLGNGAMYEHSFDQCLRRKTLSDEAADTLAWRGRRMAALAKAHGAEAIVIVAPNKGELYPERLPCPPRAVPSSLEKWLARDAEGLVLNVYPSLRAAKAKASMASPFNTHYSDAAAGIVWEDLRQHLLRRFPSARRLWTIEGRPFGVREEAGDLPKIMNFRATNRVATLPLPETHGSYISADGATHPVKGALQVEAAKGKQRVVHPQAPIARRLLVIGDSNVYALSPYLNAAFRQVDYRFLIANFEEAPFVAALEETAPDLVLWIIAERHLLGFGQSNAGH